MPGVGAADLGPDAPGPPACADQAGIHGGEGVESHPNGARTAALRRQQVPELDVVDEGGDEREPAGVEVPTDLDVRCAFV